MRNAREFMIYLLLVLGGGPKEGFGLLVALDVRRDRLDVLERGKAVDRVDEWGGRGHLRFRSFSRFLLCRLSDRLHNPLRAEEHSKAE
jgi:hypothetical protein